MSLPKRRATDNNIISLIHDVRLFHGAAVHGHNLATMLSKSRPNRGSQ